MVTLPVAGEPPPPIHMNYDITLNPEDENTSHALVTRLVGSNKSVLDVGCATGYLAETLRANGNRVWGVEADEEAAKIAAAHLEGMVVGDVETVDLVQEFGRGTFDVIVFADVLEHLRDPATLLKRSRELLADGGSVVLSIPNIAHASVRLSLLKGRFDYRPLGLLDDTHLRFFTRRSLDEMIQKAGFVKTNELRTTAAPFETEIPVFPEEFVPGVVTALSDDPDSDTYQFVVRAVPLDDPSAARPDELQHLRSALATVASAFARIDSRPIIGVIPEVHDGMSSLRYIRLAVLLSELRRRLPEFDLRVYGWDEKPTPVGLGDEPSCPLLPWNAESLNALRAATGEVLVVAPRGSPDSTPEDEIVSEMSQSGIAVVRWSYPDSMDILALAGKMPETQLLSRRRAQLAAAGVVQGDDPMLLTYLGDPSLQGGLDELITSRSELSAMSRFPLDESFNSFDSLTLVACADFVATDSVALASLAAGMSRRAGLIGSCPEPTSSALRALGVELLPKGLAVADATPQKTEPSASRELESELDRLAESLVSAFAIPLERDTLKRAEAITRRIASLEAANHALRVRLVHDRDTMTSTLLKSTTPQSERLRQAERERELSREVQYLKEEIARIYSTRSMRVMRPLRNAYGRLRSRRT